MNDYEQHAFDYFRSEGAFPLWRVSPAREWVQLALQLSLDESAIFYAITAVAVVQRSLQHTVHHSLGPPISSSQQEAALRQYCKATGALQSYIDRAISRTTSIEPVLLCCILFVCFELMRGETANAIEHLRLGRRIAAGRPKFEESITLKPQSQRRTEELILFFHKLDYDTVIGQKYGRSINWDTEKGLGRPCVPLPTSFLSLGEAKWCLGSIIKDAHDLRMELLQLAEGRVAALGLVFDSKVAEYCYAQCLSRTIEGRTHCRVLDRVHQLVRRHELWLASINTLEKTQYEETCWPFMLMRIQHFLSAMTLKTCLETRESIWDCFMDEYVSTLDLTERFLGDPTEEVQREPGEHIPGAEPQRSFSLDMGILPAIFLVCLKCRSSGVRRRAIELLHSARRREGMLWSPAMASFAATIVKLEEERTRFLQGCAPASEGLGMSEIPEEARFVDVVIAGETSSSIRVVCGRFAHESRGELELLEYRRTDPDIFVVGLNAPSQSIVTGHRLEFLGSIKMPCTPSSKAHQNGSWME